jgi:hypothetical protein
MATGIEIVGILLGSLPLIISALEHYAHGVRGITTLCELKRTDKCTLGLNHEEHEGVRERLSR